MCDAVPTAAREYKKHPTSIPSTPLARNTDSMIQKEEGGMRSRLFHGRKGTQGQSTGMQRNILNANGADRKGGHGKTMPQCKCLERLMVTAERRVR